MAPQPQVHIDHAAAQLGDLPLLRPLPLGQPHQGQQLRFAVVQHRPIGVGGQQPLQALPKPRFSVLLQRQQRVIRRFGRSVRRGPTAVLTPGQPHEAMQEVVAGVGIGFDVVDQHARRCDQLRQRSTRITAQRQPIALHPRLRDQLIRHLGVLLTVHEQRISELLRCGGGQLLEAINAELQQHVAPFGTVAAHFAEVPLRCSHLITGSAPTAEHALLAIGNQGGWRGPGQIARQPFQGLIKLAGQAAGEVEGFLLQAAPGAGEHQPLRQG